MLHHATSFSSCPSPIGPPLHRLEETYVRLDYLTIRRLGGGPTARWEAVRRSPQPARRADAAEGAVLSLTARGLSNAEIGRTLAVSEATIKSHIHHLFAKIGARDRAQAVHYAYAHGLAD